MDGGETFRAIEFAMVSKRSVRRERRSNDWSGDGLELHLSEIELLSSFIESAS